jgi:hypothetical protein
MYVVLCGVCVGVRVRVCVLRCVCVWVCSVAVRGRRMAAQRAERGGLVYAMRDEGGDQAARREQ